MELRQSRKLDHIRYALEFGDSPDASGFADIHLLHNCLPEINYSDISLATDLLGQELTHPIVINAITGGAHDVTAVNEKLAILARETHSAMAVGSQVAAIDHSQFRSSYEVVRKVNPHGVVFANIGSYGTVEQAKAAVAMVEAQALQIHLNVGQEIMMSEGDRNFAGVLDRIAEIAAALSVPVMVKEVGCGMAKEQVALLAQTGIQAVDIGGYGGTNFMAIEASRNAETDHELITWGIPTVLSILEAKAVLPQTMELIVSGGVWQVSQIVKGLVLGGKAAAIAGPILRLVMSNPLEQAIKTYCDKLEILKKYMLLLGAKKPQDLGRCPYVMSGLVQQWAQARALTSQF